MARNSERDVVTGRFTAGQRGNKVFSIATALLDRLNLAARGALQFGGARNLYQVFGYKVRVVSDDFLAKYIRQDICSRIIDAPPGATWSNPPTLNGIEGIKEWDDIVTATNMWTVMYRADRLARLNYYSIMLFGFDDSSDLTTPINAGSIKELLYVRPVGSRLIKSMSFDINPLSARFGQPEMYEVNIDDPTSKHVTVGGNVSVTSLRTLEVHHSRIVHIVENPLEDTVSGIPIIEKVYNLLDDLLKVAGGTSEAFWLTANRGMQADIDKDLDIDPADAKALSDEIEEYQHQLRRIIRTRGVDISVLDSKTPNPQQTFEMIIALISGTTGIPRRILLGSEVGQLASEQDRANWAERITERRSLFAEPTILQPTITKLQEVGLIPEGEIKIEWPSAFILSPLEEGQTMAQIARAIGNISRQTGNGAPMQLTSRQEGREIIGLDGDLPESELIEEEEPEDINGGGGSVPFEPGAQSE